MIFEIIPVEISYILSIIAYVILLLSLYIGFHLYLRKWIDGDRKNVILLTYSIMFLLLAIGRVVFLLFDYAFTNFDSALYNNYLILWKIGMAFVLLGFGVFLYIMTQHIIQNREKLKIAIILIYCIPIFIMFFMNSIESAQLVATISFVSWTVIPIGYGYVASQATGDLRKNAIMVIIGVLIFVLAYALIAEQVVQIFISLLNFSRYDVHVISAIGKTVGIVFIIKSYSLS